MASEELSSSQQSGFFSHSGELGGSHPQFTEVCTALYERELLNIAHSGPSNLSILRRRLAGLPHHVRSVARYLVANPSPLDIDAHNGSWFIKQPAKCPGLNQSMDAVAKWYSRHGQWGLVVPILHTTLEGFHIELDSIDKLAPNDGEQSQEQRLHTNLHGWFTLSGTSLEPPSHTYATKVLLKPTKAIMASACSGHTWRHKAKGAPRSLSLREMRLSTKINWNHFGLGQRSPPQIDIYSK